VICSAKTSRGTPCRSNGLAGTTICRAHGGSAPQVLAKARQRLLLAPDPVAARLIEIAMSPKTELGVAIASTREIVPAKPAR
jgi:hypothetical protein